MIFFCVTETNVEILGTTQSTLQSINFGDTLILRCYLKLGYVPTHSVKWYKNGLEVQLTNMSRASINIVHHQNFSNALGQVDQAQIALTILNVTLKDSGTFMCKATEEKNKTVVVSVKGKEIHM